MKYNVVFIASQELNDELSFHDKLPPVSGSSQVTFRGIQMPHLLLLLLALLLPTHEATKAKFSLARQPCPCSTVGRDTGHARFKRSDDRIVGGYSAKENKPWVARIVISDASYICGGSLINRRYVLTAAHCVCKPEMGLECNSDGTPAYDTKKMVTIYLGVNRRSTDLVKDDKRYAYGVEKAQAYPTYPKEYYHDISLMRLDRDAVFIRNRLQSICLPLKFDKTVDVVKKTSSVGLSVYASGWGRTFSACVTDTLGPVKSAKCEFPFSFKGKTFNSCAPIRTPSSKDKKCKDFKKKNKSLYPKQAGDAVQLLDKSTNTTCYALDARGGWCKTLGSKDDDTQWGWCEEHCKQEERVVAALAKKLQEVMLDVLPMPHCKWFTDKGKYQFNAKWEMCAGKKKSFHVIESFTKQGDKYRQKGNYTDYMGFSKEGELYPYNYYIGGSDSCNGDSGGGLYTWRDSRPELLGVVSRGFGAGKKDGCAESNFPGIYSRVSKYLEWIHENSNTGNCKDEKLFE